MAKSLLLADDSTTIQKVVELALAQEDITVVCTKSADEALARARDLRPDIIVADVFMPGKSGYDLCAAVRADPSLAHVPVLLLQSLNEPFDENRARSSGANAWIPKPFQSQALIDNVKQVMAARPAQTAPAPARPAAPAAAPAPAVGQRVATQVPPAKVPAPLPAAAAAAKPAAPAPTSKPSAPAPAAPRPATPAAPAAAAPRPPGAPPAPAAPRPPGAAPAPAAAAPRPPAPAGTPRPPGAPPAPAAPRPPGAPAPAGATRPAGPTPGPIAAGKPGVAPAAAPRPPGTPAPAAAAPRPPAQQLTAQNHEALLREALSKATKEMIEKVIWEVVPELAETMIKEELARLVKAREGK